MVKMDTNIQLTFLGPWPMLIAICTHYELRGGKTHPWGYFLTYPLHPQWNIRLQQYSATGSLSFAATCVSSQESPISSSSANTVFRHVVFGRPGFLLSGGVRLRTTLGILCVHSRDVS